MAAASGAARHMSAEEWAKNKTFVYMIVDENTRKFVKDEDGKTATFKTRALAEAHMRR